MASPGSVSPSTVQIWLPATSGLSQSLQSPLKGRTFQTMDKIKENATRRWIAMSKKDLQIVLKSGRNAGISVQDPKGNALKGTKALLSWASFFFFFNIKRLNSFRTDVWRSFVTKFHKVLLKLRYFMSTANNNLVKDKKTLAEDNFHRKMIYLFHSLKI